MAPPSKLPPEVFLGLVRQSGLIESETLQTALREIQADPRVEASSSEIAHALVKRHLLTRWQADKLLQGRHKGFLLGKYRLLSHLGSGGMSSVYLAEHRLMRRRVAIKVLPRANIVGTSHLERFHREAQAVAALDHRNIVRAYDVDQEGDVHFLVMEYVSGRSLHEIVTTEGPLAPIAAAEYVRQAAEGLQQAHKAGMVHRDIKPGNLLLDDRGTIKILDLGLARFFDEKDESSVTKRHDEKVLGTADYLSPEQALDSHTVDVRSDIYSLGCTLYYLLVGHPPFPEGTLANRLLAHQTKQPATIPTLRPEVPPGLVAIVEKMMAKHPDDRFQTARDAANALSDWLSQNGGETWAEMNPVLGPAGGPPNQATFIQPIPGPAAPITSQTITVPRSVGTGRAALTPPSGNDAPVSPPAAEFLTGPGDPFRRPPAVIPAVGGSDLAFSEFLTRLEDPETQPLARDQGSPSELEPTLIAPQPARPPQSAIVAGDLRDTPPALHSDSSSAARRAASADDPRFAPTQIQSPAARLPPTRVAESQTGDSTGAQAQTARRRKQIWIAVGTGVLSLASALFVVYNRLPPTKSTNNGQAASPKGGKAKGAGEKKKVEPIIQAGSVRRELTVGPGQQFPTIAAALADASKNANTQRRARQTIRLAPGQVFAERIVLDSRAPRGIHFVCEGPQPAVLAPPGPDPVVSVTASKGELWNFHLEGVRIDAVGKETAVKLQGWIPGAQFVGVEITGFSRSAVQLTGVQSFSSEDATILLERLQIHNAGSPEAVGIELLPLGDQHCSQIRVRGCRLLPPLAAGIRANCDVHSLEIEESVFFRTRFGIELLGESRTFRNLLVAANTFYENELGVQFAQMPSMSTTGLGFYNNLFVDAKSRDAVVATGYKQPEFLAMFATNPSGVSLNWTTRTASDKPPPEELAYLFEAAGGRFGAQPRFVSTDPAHPDFLRPAPGSPQAKVGTAQALLTRKRFGAQIGAVRPNLP